MNVEEYLNSRYFSHSVAENAMRDFSILKRRLNKYKRGTNGEVSILNIIIGIEAEFEQVFIDHILKTRFNLDERKIYSACLRYKGDKRMNEYNVEFFRRIEADMKRIRHG